jgi:hypothetical protein
MLPTLKRLLLGISLIVLASTVLLLSDLKRRTLTAGAMPHIGLLQHASVVLLDDTVRGMVDSLAENGLGIKWRQSAGLSLDGTCAVRFQ